jgi:hypothetical protein
MVKNGFFYDVYGSSQDSGLKNTTWSQKNITHAKHRVRKIFRFDSKTKEFQTIQPVW